MRWKTILILVAAFWLQVPSMPAQSTLYWGGGTSNIADGTPLPTSFAGMAGNWTTGLENWSNAVSPTDYGTWVDGSVANLGYITANGTATITPNFSMNLAGLVFNALAAPGNNQNITINPGSAQTVSLTGSGATWLIHAQSNTSINGIVLGANISLGAGSTPLIKDGLGHLTLNGGNSNAYTGPVQVRSGNFIINSNSTLNGVTQFNVSGYRTPNAGSTSSPNDWSSPDLRLTIANMASNQIADGAVLTLGRGDFQVSSAGTSSTETIGRIVLQPYGIISAGSGSAGVLTLGDATAGIHRGATGLGTLSVNVTSGTENTATAIRVSNGVATDVLLPWISTNRGEFMLVDSTNNNTLTRVASTVNNAVGSWVAGQNYRVDAATTGTVSSDLTINSLGFRNTVASQTVTIDAGRTLTIASGGLVSQTAGVGGGAITGGSLTTTAPVFYISTGTTNASSFTINSVLTGSYDIVKSGAVDLVLGGSSPNTYVGSLHIHGGGVAANKSGAITGNVFVRDGGGLNVGNATALASTSNVTVDRHGLLATGSTSAVFGGVVTINGGQFVYNNGFPVFNHAGTGLAFNGGTMTFSSTGAGSIDLFTNVSYAASSERQAVFQRINTGANSIRLHTGASAGNAERTFDIADSTTLAPGVAEMVVDTVIANGGSGTTTGSIRKTGAGTLQFTGANTYSGGTTIDGGTLQLSTISASAQSGLTATASNGGPASNVLTFNRPITGTMVVGQSVTGTGITTGRFITGILNEYQVQVNGAGGTGANVVSTDVALGSVSRSGSLGGGAVTVNNTGTLLVDAGITVGNTVTVNTGGTFRNNGTFNGTLTVNSGGRIGGSGTYASAVTLGTGTRLAPGNSPGLTTFSSGLTLNTGANFDFELIANTTAGRGTNYDGVDVTGGAFVLQSGVNFNIQLNSAGSAVDFANSFWASDRQWLVFDVVNDPGTLPAFNIGTVSQDSLGQNASSYGTFSTTQIGNNVYLTWTAIPEPSTSMMVLGGLAALYWLRRRA